MSTISIIGLKSRHSAGYMLTYGVQIISGPGGNVEGEVQFTWHPPKGPQAAGSPKIITKKITLYDTLNSPIPVSIDENAIQAFNEAWNRGESGRSNFTYTFTLVPQAGGRRRKTRKSKRKVKKLKKTRKH